MVKTTTKVLSANIGEEIGQELGAEMISSYRNANPADVTSYFVGRNVIEQILAQPGCIGIKFYNAYNEVGEKTLVYVGVNGQGNDMLSVTTINVSGELDSAKGIVADRVKIGQNIEDFWWVND